MRILGWRETRWKKRRRRNSAGAPYLAWNSTS
jgi:hypothetical protein